MEELGMQGYSIQAKRGGSYGGCGGGGGGGSGTKCGRWNPTAEQVKVLTDLFRSGLRTPSTDQIQKISTQLSYYGKIESKNVFYWFQNHKARERQKRRRVSKENNNNSNSNSNNNNNNNNINENNIINSNNIINNDNNNNNNNDISCFQELDDHQLNKALATSTKYFGEVNQVTWEPTERAIETLQLFPLNSYNEIESENKLRMFSNNNNGCKENNYATFAYSFGRDFEFDHPPLDLRLSFF